jgi:hypothetical protein
MIEHAKRPQPPRKTVADSVRPAQKQGAAELIFGSGLAAARLAARPATAPGRKPARG